MSSTPQQVNNVLSSTEGALGKRKKSRNSKGSYLTKWLDKTMRHIQETTANTNPYDSYVAPNLNWPVSTLGSNHEIYRNNIYGYLPDPSGLPTSSMYCNPHVHPAYNSSFRCVHHSEQTHRPRLRHNENKAEEVSSAPMENVDSMISHSYMPKNSENQDYTSLPPIVTSIGDTNSTSDINAPKEDSGNDRRYSDPCVRGLPDVARPANGDVDSVSEESSDFSENEVGSRLLACLLDQITTLKGANEKLNRELQETRAELETLRHQTAFIQNATSTNLGATGSPLHNNGLLNGQYPPGLLTDLVREIRDAARLREEALYTRVRAMVLERIDNSYASTESKKSERTIEDLKSALRAADADSRRMMDRITKLEEDVRLLRVNESDTSENRITNGNVEDAETERLRLRKEIENIRKAKQSSDEHALKLERLVTQLRSKFTCIQSTNGPESLPSESEHDTNARIRRTSGNSSNNSTVVFGPVTDL